MGTRGARRRKGWLLGALVVLPACVGSVDRREFDQMVRERGGGLSGDLLVSALDAIEEYEQTTSLDVVSATLTSGSVSLAVRSTEFPDEVDRWTYTVSRRLFGPSPGPDLDPGAPSRTFASGSVDPNVIEAAIDVAVAGTQVRAGWAANASLRVVAEGEVELRVSITNERRDETWVFDGTGTVVGVQ